MKFLNLLKKYEKGSTHFVMLLVGIGFLVFTILPLVLPSWSSDSSPLMSIIFALVGLVMIVFGFRGLKNVATTTLEQTNYFDQVDKGAVDPAVIEAIRSSNSPLKDYYFHYCGKLNQSYILETTDREPTYEINCDKMGMVNDFIFTFKNHLTGKEFTSNVTHTMTVSYGSDNFSLVDKSYFKIDGKNIWEYIAEMGYSVEPYLDPVAFSFRIRHYGVEVADLKCAGTNVLPQYEGKQGLRNVAMSSGLYRVSCRDEDVEAVAIIAFAVSRVQII
ncbi:MAG: phage holin family protein [Erysipelotrichaceae bacterium]|nr:phage holin family protein [Erysipelotrichaceae bacterium]